MYTEKQWVAIDKRFAFFVKQNQSFVFLYFIVEKEKLPMNLYL